MKNILKTKWVEKIKKKNTSLPNLAWGIWFLDRRKIFLWVDTE